MLRVLSGSGAGTELVAAVVVGSAETCDLRLGDPNVAAHHLGNDAEPDETGQLMNVDLVFWWIEDAQPVTQLSPVPR
jgi:hypothetical protein